MGAASSQHSNSSCVTGRDAVETVFKAIPEIVKELQIGDIIQSISGIFGIVTKVGANDGKVVAPVNGITKEVDISSFGNTVKKNNFCDHLSAPYGQDKIAQNARDAIGNSVGDSEAFVKKCRNGI